MTASSKQIMPIKAQAISSGMSTREPAASTRSRSTSECSGLKADKVNYGVVSVM
jgi:hypothetical protein